MSPADTGLKLGAGTLDPVKVQQVLTWMLEGHTEHAIRDSVAGNWPGESAEPLIFAAIDRVNESGNMPHTTVENWAFEATRLIYQKSLDISDFAGAMRAVKQLREISAARTNQEPPPKKHEHTHQHELGPVTQGNMDAHRERLAERIAGLR